MRKIDLDLSDEALLNLLFYQTSKVKFTKGTARKLLTCQKNLKQLLYMSPGDLLGLCKQINDLATGEFLVTLSEILKRLDRKDIKRPILKSYVPVCRWLQKELGYTKREYVCELYLNTAYELIGYQRSWSGTDAHVPFYPREILERVINMGAHRLILVHNHPSGISIPSFADIELTKKLQNSLQDITCELLDHLIIAKNKPFSFKKQGLL